MRDRLFAACAAAFLGLCILLQGDASLASKGAPLTASAGAPDPDATRRKYFTDLKLVTHEGKEVRFYSDILRDRIVLISFFYINCKTDSPRQNVVLGRVATLLRERLGKDVHIVSITVDPEHDTPVKLKDYAKVFNAGGGWTFLTGKKENVDWVTYKLGQYAPRPEEHSLIFLAGNVKGDRWLKIGKDAKPDLLVEKILALVNEKQE